MICKRFNSCLIDWSSDIAKRQSSSSFSPHTSASERMNECIYDKNDQMNVIGIHWTRCKGSVFNEHDRAWVHMFK